MDWDKYIGLVDVLGLDYCDLRNLDLSIDKYDRLRVSNETLGKLGYFTPDFYMNLLKLSKYMKDNICNNYNDYYMNINIKDKQVRYVYGFRNIGLNTCLKFQNNYKDKKILDFNTSVLFNSPVLNRCVMFIMLSYVDDALEHIIDKLDFSFIEDMMLCETGHLSKIKDKKVICAFKDLENIKVHLKEGLDIETLVYGDIYKNVVYTYDNNTIELSYDETKDTQTFNYSHSYGDDRVVIRRQILNKMDTGVMINHNEKSWRL